jgi:hypothetical protein
VPYKEHNHDRAEFCSFSLLLSRRLLKLISPSYQPWYNVFLSQNKTAAADLSAVKTISPTTPL